MIGGARQSDGTLVAPDTQLRIDKALIDRINGAGEFTFKISVDPRCTNCGKAVG
jgi:hypothetical protein